MGEKIRHEKLNPLRSNVGFTTSSQVSKRPFASLIERDVGRSNLCSLPLPSLTLSDNPETHVYVVSGEIETFDDGIINPSKSSDTIIVYNPTTGKREMTSPRKLKEVQVVATREREMERQSSEIYSRLDQERYAEADQLDRTKQRLRAKYAGEGSVAAEGVPEDNTTVGGVAARRDGEGLSFEESPLVTEVKESTDALWDVFGADAEAIIGELSVNPDYIPEGASAYEREVIGRYVEARRSLRAADEGASGAEISDESMRGEDNSLTLLHGNRSEQNNDVAAQSSGNDSGRLASDPAGGLEGDRDRSDIRVYEEGLASSYDAYSQHSERNRRRTESERLVNLAHANDQYIERGGLVALGDRHHKHSGESEVFIDSENGMVYKAKDPYAKSPMKGGVAPEDAIFEHLVHNKYFPETHYGFVGINDVAGDVRIVLSQKYIDSTGQASKKQIEVALAEKGLYPEGKYNYGNDEVTVTDVDGDNALLGADGKVYFIDPVINFKKPVREILGGVETSAVESPAAQAETALSRVPLNAEGNPDFMGTDAATAWDALVEKTGSEESAQNYAAMMAGKKEKALAKAEKVKVAEEEDLDKFAEAEAARVGAIAQAKAELEHWQKIAGESGRRKAETERAKEVEREQKRKAEEEEQRKAVREKGQTPSNEAGEEVYGKWGMASPYTEGREDTVTLADGEEISGKWVVVEAGTATPSHDPLNGYVKSAGYPVDEKGNTVNDRDYEGDRAAQQDTEAMAAVYDGRAVDDPVIVSDEGVVYSGNGRTMARILAAVNGTDGKYIESLQRKAGKYGIDPEALKGFEHPQLVFLTDKRLPYTAETLARFNARTTKSMSTTEQSVKDAKAVSNAAMTKVLDLMDEYETLDTFYGSPQAAAQLVAYLREDGIINEKDLPSLFMADGRLEDTARTRIEGMLIGKTFSRNPDVIRMCNDIPRVRQVIVKALGEIAKNSRLGEYSLESVIGGAIELINEARRAGYKEGSRVSEIALQKSILDIEGINEGSEIKALSETARSLESMMLADAIYSGKVAILRDILALYNESAAGAAYGEVTMFGEQTPQEILREAVEVAAPGLLSNTEKLIQNGREEKSNTGTESGGKEEGSGASATENADRGGEESSGEVDGTDKPVFSIDDNVDGNKETYDVAKDLVESAIGRGNVVEVSGAEAAEMLGHKKASLDTGKANHEGAEVPAISSDDVAKIQQNLESKVKKYENNTSVKSKQHAARTLRGDISEALGIPERGQSSRYVNIESVSGKHVTLRISNHNGKVSNFDTNGEEEGISIVISRDINRSLTNNGNAHVIEFFYSDKKLAKAEGNPYVDILKGLQQLLYSGEYKDITGVAEVQEVNGSEAAKYSIEKVSAKDSEYSDIRFMRNGEGVVYGWTIGGKVYLNRDAMNPETPLHEYTHLWDEMVRRENPELWERGKKLLKETPLWEEVVNDPNYADIRGDEDAVASEVHSRLTGKEGAEMLDSMVSEARGKGLVAEAEAVSLVGRIRRWLADMFKGLKATLGKWSKRELEELTLDDFNRMTLRDLAEGVDPRGEGRIDERESSPRMSAAMTRGSEDFDAIRDRAVAERGIVMPGLREVEFNVVAITPMSWAGNFSKTFNEIIKPVIKSMPRTGYHVTDSNGTRVPVKLNSESISKLKHRNSYDESLKDGRSPRKEYFAVIKNLSEVLDNAVEVELHGDYSKDINGERGNESVGREKLVHRYCSAVRLAGSNKISRVTFTILENKQRKQGNVVHSQDVMDIKIEPSEDTDSPISGNEGAGLNTYSTLAGAKLLKGVEKSYDPGVKLLDSSETIYAEEPRGAMKSRVRVSQPGLFDGIESDVALSRQKRV